MLQPHAVLAEWLAGRASTDDLILALRERIAASLPPAVQAYAAETRYSPLLLPLERRRRAGFTSAKQAVYFCHDTIYSAFRRHERRLLENNHNEKIDARLVLIDQVETEHAVQQPVRREMPPLVSLPPHIADFALDAVPSLALFAALPPALTPKETASARILALRVFGGWSLKRIAEREGLSFDAVMEAWRDARIWLDQTSRTGRGLGEIAKLDIFEHDIIAALQESPDLLGILDWRTFERALARLLAELGFEVELRRGTKDGGIDVVAVRHDTTFGAHRYLIQAKRSSRAIGVEPVRELLFLKQKYGATKACLATTASFTSGARQLAEEHRWELELRDFELLTEWLEMTKSKTPPNAY